MAFKGEVPSFDSGPRDLFEALKECDRLRTELTSSRQREEELEGEVKRRDLALQSLTPMGSEYVNDPERCVAFARSVREQHRQTTIEAIKRRKAAEKREEESQGQVAGMREALSGLVDAVVAEVNEKGGGGFILARLSDARAALATTPPNPIERPLEDCWLIYFSDQDVRPEIFVGEGAEAAARHRYKQCLVNWSCHLFHRVASSQEHERASLPGSPRE